MEGVTYRDIFPDEVSENISLVDDELKWISPQTKEFLLFWLRQKTKRGKASLGMVEQPLFKGAELSGHFLRALSNEDFEEFDNLYMDYLYGVAKKTGFSDKALNMLTEYLNEKKTLAELSILSEHLLEDEMTNTVMRILREEPKESWYDNLIIDCEESVAARQYYANLFGVKESEVFPVNGDLKLENNTVVYMSLADGAAPEPAMFIKNMYDHRQDKMVSVFCHEDPCDNDSLEYFTVSSEEAGFIPMVLRMDDDSNMERFSLWIKNKTDFSDDVYLGKPTATEISQRYMAKSIGNQIRFDNGMNKLIQGMEKQKDWSLEKGEAGELLSKMPAYAKIKAFRIKAEMFEMTGSYSLSYKKLLEMMQEEEKEQKEVVEAVFMSMREYAKLEQEAEQNAEQDVVKEKESSLLKGQQKSGKEISER